MIFVMRWILIKNQKIIAIYFIRFSLWRRTYIFICSVFNCKKCFNIQLILNQIDLFDLNWNQVNCKLICFSYFKQNILFDEFLNIIFFYIACVIKLCRYCICLMKVKEDIKLLIWNKNILVHQTTVFRV